MQPGTLQVYAWGEGGNGGTSAHGSNTGAGGGGGALGGETNLGGVTPGSTVLTITIGTGGSGTDTTVTGGSVTVTGARGQNGAGSSAGTGGAAGSNSVAFAGGNGANTGGANNSGGGGGGSAGAGSAGGAASLSAGGSAGTGSAGPPSLAGAAGASGAGNLANGANGTAPGSGASGGGSGGAINHTGGTGAAGQVIFIWTTLTYSLANYAAMPYVMATAKKAISGFKFYSSFVMAPLPVSVVNQWTGTFAQPAAFGNMPPALQSTVIALTPATSAGIGSGVPTAGSWLFCVAGMNEQSASSGFTVAATDDIHSFWRPGNVTTSAWAVSAAAAETRTSIWYTANLSRVPGDVYCAPSGCMAGMAVTVLEVSGLGAWDTVTGIATGYAAAATSLNLALSAPSGPAFILAAATGDLSTAGQALTPGSPWRTLTTVTAANGSDHTCDTVLTTAYLGSTSGSVSINATASSATDLSGVIIGVLTAGPTPATGTNAAWPGRTILEAALGSGYETPPDQMTWTALSDSAWGTAAGTSDVYSGTYTGTYGVPVTGYKRYWSFGDNSGVPYALGQLQSSSGVIQLDNADGNLSPQNSASPFYPNLQPGTPVRVRAAIGTIGGVTCNRWYVFQRNALGWPEQRNKALRGFVPLTTTDIWSVVAGSPPSPYRAEVLQDLQGTAGWWWPCDDQSLSGGVLPTSLRNAAPGTSTVLQIVSSPGGVSSQDSYSTTGTDLTALVGSIGGVPPPSVAVYDVAQQSGFLYGDPQSSPASSTAGGPVTASPGAAAWQQTGLLGNTGSAGWFLAANDTYPSLTTGCTVEGWYNYGFSGSGTGFYTGSTYVVVAAQPPVPLTLWELATASAPLAILQLDTSGHLNLLTYNGGTGTSHSVYTGSDLRCDGWFKVTATLTSAAWTVKVNAGLTASASGSATISPTSPAWFIANGDLGSSGGSTLSAIQHGGNVAISHLVIYPAVQPAWRELSRYAAAITGFGVLPAPTSLALSSVANQTQAGGLVPDGSEFQGGYGLSGTTLVPYTFSAVAAAAAGSYTSGPSSRAVHAGLGGQGGVTGWGATVWASWSSLAPLVHLYTSAAAVTETEAGACAGAGNSYTSGYGSGASGHGVCQVSSGTGASPPASPSALGDTLGQRIERILGNGGITQPMRAIDQEPLQVQAALDTGGAAVGSSVSNMVTSGSGLLYVGTDGYLRYRMKSHLAADVTVWLVGMNAGQVPFAGDISWSTDPQKVFNAIEIAPYSPDGATLPLITPASSTAVKTSQTQYGAKPFAATSYLQSQAEILSYANWVLAQYGQPSRRADVITIDAASHPAAWPMVMGCNPTDLVLVYDAPIGQPATTGVYRASQLARTIAFGANGQPVKAELKLTLDSVPSSYWT